jgi:hypothetical protein
MVRVFLLFILAIIFFGCTTPVLLTTTQSPELVLEMQPAKIVFSNQFDYLNNPGIKDKHEAAYQTGIDRFAQTLCMDTVHQNPVVNFRMDRSGTLHKSGELFERNIDKGEIGTLCRSNEAAFLLSLDSLRLHFEWEVIREDQQDGGVSKSKDFYLISNYYVTLYDSAGGLVKRTLLEKSMLYTSRPTLGALITILPNIANATAKIAVLARNAANEYLRMFYPAEVVAGQRYLYTGKLFEETNRLIFQKQYDQAVQLLEQMPFSSNRSQGKKILHNLSVAKEFREYYAVPK